MKITVSTIRPEDLVQWQVLYRGYAHFYQVPMNDDILNTIWSWLLDEKNQFYGQIAKNNDNQALGFMHYREMPSPLRGRVVGFLDDLYVDPGYRGMGVVDALNHALVQSAKANNWPFVRWITADNNYRARALYDKIASKTNWVTYQLPIETKT